MTTEPLEPEIVEECKALATQGDIANPAQAMIDKVLSGAITADSVGAMREAVALFRDMEKIGAEKAFARDMAALQAELPHVMARRAIPDGRGGFRGSYASHEDIMRDIGPKLVKFGFSISFDTDVDDKRLTAICKVTHRGGYTKETKFAVRNSKGPPGASDAQVDGSNNTYAMRYALCNALNLVIDKDADARIEGGVIAPEEAKELQERVKACAANEATFLKLAAAQSYATIREGKLEMLRKVLDGLEKKKVGEMGAATKATAAPAAPVEPPPVAQEGRSTQQEGQRTAERAPDTPPPVGGPSSPTDLDVVRAVAWCMGGRDRKGAGKALKVLTIAAVLPAVALSNYNPEDLAALAVVAKRVAGEKGLDWTPHLPGGPDPITETKGE